VQALLNQGITYIQDAHIDDSDILERLADVDRRGVPMPYITAHLAWSYPEGETRQQLEETIRNRAQYETRHISTSAIKVMLDGVPVPPAFTHVPLGPDGKVDETNLLVPRDVLAQKLIEWDQAQLKVKMHAAGSGAVRVGLDAIEAARQANGQSGILHEIAHTARVSDVDIPRFARLQAVAEVSPYFWHLGGPVEGPSYQFRALHDNGALITIGSDYSVVESFNPFPPLQGVVTREGESVPINIAIEFLTRNAAESVSRLPDMGSIEAGKIANMVVLDRNLLEIPDNEISESKVLKTILDGEVVYESK
jgi:predicted amidohydrolase YtcJ